MGRTKKTAMALAEIGEDLSRLRGEFERWRATRTAGKRIPAQLWASAAELARRHGVHHVADVLRLEYAGLKRRMTPSGSGEQPSGQPPVAPEFVEMFVPASTPAPTSPPTSPTITEAARAECVVELINVRGTKMRVELNAASVAGLTALCNAFCAAA